MRKSSHTILHTACGDIRQIQLNGNELVVYVEDDYLYNVINKPNNLKILIDTIKQVNPNASLNIKKREKASFNIEKDILELKKKFGKMFTIK